MKIIIAIGHPSDVHFFKNIISGLKNQGHFVTVIAREKEVTFYLLKAFSIDFIQLSSHKKQLWQKLFNYGYRWWKTYQICRKIRPDVSFGVGDFILPQISRIMNFRSIVFTDIESVRHDALLTFPFASLIVTPVGFRKDLGKKHVRVKSYKEMAYINKDFIPDPSVLKDLGVDDGRRFVVLRFVSHSAVHDFGHKGITEPVKIRIAQTLGRYATVFISSEDPLPDALKPYRLTIGPERIHSVMFYACLLYGESSTMAAECALMGTPAIFVDKNSRGYTEEIESRSGLIYNFSPGADDLEQSIKKAIDIIIQGQGEQEKRKDLVNDSDDITRFILNL